MKRGHPGFFIWSNQQNLNKPLKLIVNHLRICRHNNFDINLLYFHLGTMFMICYRCNQLMCFIELGLLKLLFYEIIPIHLIFENAIRRNCSGVNLIKIKISTNEFNSRMQYPFVYKILTQFNLLK